MYVLDITKIAAATDMHSIVRITAQQLQRDTYLRLGDWLQQLSLPDLVSLVYMVDAMRDSTEDPCAQTISTLSLMLAQAEGTDIMRNDAYTYMGILSMLIAAESMARKGLVEIDYNKITLDPSSIHDKVIKLTDKYINEITKETDQGDQSDDSAPSV